MLPDYLRNLVREIVRERGSVNLAIFGPGKGSPFFEKRRSVFELLQRQHPDADINFYMIDDIEPPAADFEDYLRRVRPAEIEQVKWADIIIFIFTHHKLTAFVEFLLVLDHEKESGQRFFDRCGLAVADSLEVSSLWFYEAKRACQGRSDRIIQFSQDDLQSCRVATDFAVDLFERIVLERWAPF
jgi:hypothetical protein